MLVHLCACGGYAGRMTVLDFALMAAVFSACSIVSALLGWRMKNERADVGLMAGTGAAFGGISLALFAI